jgi:hypothetical protein
MDYLNINYIESKIDLSIREYPKTSYLQYDILGYSYGIYISKDKISPFHWGYEGIENYNFNPIDWGKSIGEIIEILKYFFYFQALTEYLQELKKNYSKLNRIYYEFS